MKIKILNQDGTPKGEHEIALRSDFSKVSPQVAHDAIVTHLANRRAGTASTKTVAEVAGSGKKPWKQKGTGRARAGYARSPVWRKGGVVFGPKPRDYRKRMPRQVRRLAFCQALAGRLQDGSALVVESLDVPSAKTRDFVEILRGLKVEGSALVVHEKPTEALRRASRNVARVNTAMAADVNTYQILNCERLVLTRAALDALAARSQGLEAAQ
ncbi:MAG: 50S ribosomal protein L4 [Verrucomicrobiae bacterium]|nr:50S ribosomal protein L4 [Verrucomicrobiae bacterium]